MANAAARPCRHLGCGTLVRDGSGYCPQHQKERQAGKFGDSRRGSRHERGYGSDWVKIRHLVLTRDNGLCIPCQREGRITLARHVDHIINKAEWQRTHGSLSGVDDESNLQSICVDCHRRKTQAEAMRARTG